MMVYSPGRSMGSRGMDICSSIEETMWNRIKDAPENY